MANYKETEVLGTQWTRANQITINNPFASTPSINFSEEKIIQLGGSTVSQTVNGLNTSFNATSTFPILDPNTLEPTGETKSHMDIYTLLFSLYIDLATKRDTPPPLPPVYPPETPA